MTESSNKLSRFWQELRRRRVIRVTAMYAATAFIIMEAADIMLPRLGLPDWTVTFLIVLLIAGLPVAIILSWIFEVTPEGIERTESTEDQSEGEVLPSGRKRKRKLKASDVIIAALFVVVLILLYPKIFKSDRLEEFRSQGEISIAVMPFQNLTGDTAKNFLQVLAQDNLITSLSNAEELQVRQTESVISLLQNSDLKNYATLTSSVAGNLSQKLGAGVFVYGSINQIGEDIRLNAKLIDSETQEVFQSFQIGGNAGDIFDLTDSLSRMVKNYLIITVLKKELDPESQKYIGNTNSAEATRYYIQGKEAFFRRDYIPAAEMFRQSVQIDSNFAHAAGYLALSYMNRGINEEARKWTLIAFEKKEEVSRRTQYMIEWLYANFFQGPSEALIPLRQLMKMDDQTPFVHYLMGLSYTVMHQYERAIPYFERSLEIYERWDIKPAWVYIYTGLGDAYHQTGQYRMERKLYRNAEKDFPGDPIILRMQAVLALSQGKTNAADEYIGRYISILEGNAYSEAAITSGLGSIYRDAGLFDKAEEFYRRALSLEPDRAVRLNNLAWFLIHYDRDIDEGLELIKKALEIRPGDYLYLDTKGWGLYKQGKYREALEFLEKSWESKPMYDYDIYLHLEEARKAVSDQS